MSGYNLNSAAKKGEQNHFFGKSGADSYVWKGGEVKKVCQFCGSDFMIPPAWVKKGAGKHCSRKCFCESRKNKIGKACRLCGNKFLTIPSKIQKGFGVFCSRKCKILYLTKENNPNWKGGVCDDMLAYKKRYSLSPEGKESTRKRNAIRRTFGFVPLNKIFKGSAGHHIDRERVIYIPLKMHEDNRHSVLRNQGMETINKLAFEFLEGQCVST